MRPRVLYFTIFIVYVVSNGRFLALFLKHEAGLDDSIIGIVYATKVITALPIITAGGYYADHLERTYPGYGRLFVLATGIVLSMFLYCLQGLSYLMPSVEFFKSLPWYCTIQICIGVVTSILSPVLDGICLDYLQSEAIVHDANDNKNNNNNTNDVDNNNNEEDIVHRNNYNPVECNSKQDKITNQQQFGKERVFGAYSWAIMNIILSYILDHTKVQFRVTYVMTIVSSCVALLTIYFYAISNNNDNMRNPLHCRTNRFELLNKHDSNTILNDDDNDDNDDETVTTTITNQTTTTYRDDFDGISDVERSDGLDDEIIQSDPTMDCPSEMYDVLDDVQTSTIPLSSLVQMVMVSSVLAIPFSIAFITLSSGQAIVDNLVFLFFEELGSSYTVMGWTVVLTVSFEIPIFYIAPMLLQKLGAEILLLIAAACYIFRVIGYTLVPSNHVMYILLLEPCHGITYACSATAAVDYISRLIPSGYEASGQSILYLLKSIGTIIGLGMGGILQGTIGPRWMYRISAFVVTIGTLIFAMAYLLYDKNLQPSTKVRTK